ncbi:hypothetical protein [Kordia zhangzhouensis]|uniref:hypothetical protein n=1 Tax=Kordia zhangzhouensis TaxID=1620405 RepID=UPI0012F7EF47|nr:hypothetical protein [Kordia zhangzhouensis]
MEIIQKIKDICLACLLLLTLATPSFIQFSHQLIEEHETRTCHEQKEHIHENNVHCDLCTYHFSNYYFEFTSLPNLLVAPIISNPAEGTIKSLCHYLPLTNKRLRAPPYNS